jgi:acetyl-CoA acetyltransferase
VSPRSHAGGALNPKTHRRKTLTEDQGTDAPKIAHPLGLFGCSGVCDGSACPVVTTYLYKSVSLHLTQKLLESKDVVRPSDNGSSVDDIFAFRTGCGLKMFDQNPEIHIRNL